MRTTTRTVTFRRPFCLKGVDRLLPPADYRVMIDEELIELQAAQDQDAGTLSMRPEMALRQAEHDECCDHSEVQR